MRFFIDLLARVILKHFLHFQQFFQVKLRLKWRLTQILRHFIINFKLNLTTHLTFFDFLFLPKDIG